LITRVADRETRQSAGERTDPDTMAEQALPLRELAKTRLDNQNCDRVYRETAAVMARVVDAFSTGNINLVQRSQAEQLELRICRRLRDYLAAQPELDQSLLAELREKLAHRFFLNLSIFQSLPDIWALDQVFPVMPLQRLTEEPGERAILCDLSCDSDGRIDQYINRNGLGSTLAVHAPLKKENYLLGVFLVGAYQEILGDMHNLFGDTDSVDIEAKPGGNFRLVHAEPADTASEVLQYVHYEPGELLTELRGKLRRSELTNDEEGLYLSQFRKVLDSSTYPMDRRDGDETRDR